MNALLARLRQLAVLLLLVVASDGAAEQLLHRTLLPSAVDLDLTLGAVALGLIGLTAGALEGSARRRSQAEREELLALRAKEEEELRRRATRRARVETVIEGHDNPEMVFQPIVDLRSLKVYGYEALSRFAIGRPDEWFAEAAAVGLGMQLEVKAIRRALACLEELPGASTYLSVNASPETLVSPGFPEILEGVDLSRVVVELTEHECVDDYDKVRQSMAALREQGGRLAIDDVGAGYSSLRHIARLEPDIIKLDTAFTRAVKDDATERSMVGALVGLAHAVGATVVVEGIEDEETLRVVRELGAQCGQGWHFGKPKPLEALGPRIPAARGKLRVVAQG